MYSRIVNAAAGVISSFSQDFYFFLILRFLSGVGSVKKASSFFKVATFYIGLGAVFQWFGLTLASSNQVIREVQHFQFLPHFGW